MIGPAGGGLFVKPDLAASSVPNVARKDTSPLRRLRGRRPPTWLTIAVVLAGAVIYGLVGIHTPFLGTSFYDAMITTLAFAVMALGLNIVVGFAGLLDLGYVAFYAFGSFVAGWLMSEHFADLNVHLGVSPEAAVLPGLHINFFLVIFIAAGFTALWGVILGAPTLRLRGDYLAIVTLAFGEIVPRVLKLSTDGIFGIGSFDLSKGNQGITPVDPPWAALPGFTDVNPLNIRPYYFIALAMLLITLFVNVRLRDSRLGRAWIAVREDETAAAAMGINLVRVKLWAYAIGAAFGGFAGAFLGVYSNTVNVSEFEFGFSVFVLCMIILGGMGNIAGVVVGAFALSMINRFVLPELDSIPDRIGLNFDISAVAFGLFGFFLVLLMVLRPEGLLPNRRRKLELHESEIEHPKIVQAGRGAQ